MNISTACILERITNRQKERTEATDVIAESYFDGMRDAFEEIARMGLIHEDSIRSALSAGSPARKKPSLRTARETGLKSQIAAVAKNEVPLNSEQRTKLEVACLVLGQLLVDLPAYEDLSSDGRNAHSAAIDARLAIRKLCKQ